MLDSYYKDKANSETDQETDEENDVVEEYKEQALEESEKCLNSWRMPFARYGIQDQVEVDFNAQYVMLNMNGALLF